MHSMNIVEVWDTPSSVYYKLQMIVSRFSLSSSDSINSKTTEFFGKKPKIIVVRILILNVVGMQRGGQKGY